MEEEERHDEHRDRENGVFGDRERENFDVVGSIGFGISEGKLRR
jgi:hypothetical protein